MRLRPLTEKYQLEMLASFGASDVVLLVSDRGEQIEHYFEAGRGSAGASPTATRMRPWGGRRAQER